MLLERREQMKSIRAVAIYVFIVVGAVYLVGFLVGCSTVEKDPFALPRREREKLEYEIIRDTCKANGLILYCTSRGATSHSPNRSCGCMRRI
jgi:hypothetical protein